MKKPITNISQLNLAEQYTYADYLTWQFSERVELIRGWVSRMTPAPRRRHQAVIGKLFRKISDVFENNKCEVYIAPFDVRLQKNKGQNNKEVHTVVQPDISIICDKNKLDDRGCIGAPDMIIEILSPSTTKKDYTEKYTLYEENGVKEYWIVNPDTKSIETFILTNDQYESEGVYSELYGFKEIPVSIFPGLTLKLIEIFED